MAEPILAIPLEQLKIRPDARPIKTPAVDELAESMRESGLLQAIVVRPIEGGNYELLAGGHRVAAARALGWTEIDAKVETVDDNHAELAMIDENLIRGELTPAQRASQTGRRQELYELIHPETKHGVAGGKAKARKAKSTTAKFAIVDGDSKPPAEGFVEATAKATGKSGRAVRLDAQRHRELGGETLKAVEGTALDQGDQLDALAKTDPATRADLVERARAGEKVDAKTEVKKAKRKAREAELADNIRALPVKRYGVILADPEWQFEVRSEKGKDRSADNHYPTSSIEEIAARPVATIAANDCVLFLWSTAPMLDEALGIMRAWGFKYVSRVVWGKDRAGTGFWFRDKAEELLVGVKGDVVPPAPGTQWDSLQMASVGRHSQKPDLFYRMIEEYFPTVPKIELNARRRRFGWDAWGNELAPAEADAKVAPPPANGADAELADRNARIVAEVERLAPDGKGLLDAYRQVGKDFGLSLRRVRYVVAEARRVAP